MRPAPLPPPSFAAATCFAAASFVVLAAAAATFVVHAAAAAAYSPVDVSICVFLPPFRGGIPQDMILRSFLPLRIGSTYKVQPGDTLARIAARLRTTVKKILEVNPDIKTPQIESNQVSLFACLSRDLSLYLHPLNPIPPLPLSVLLVLFITVFLREIMRNRRCA